MLSREDRILSELIVSRGLADPAVVENRARQLEDSDENGLVRALVSHGELDPEAGRQVRDEAREIGELLRADLPEGQRLGEFRLVREIGRGGMGIVYEAEQVSLGRRVALKVLPAGAALDERLAIRFLREARTAARLRHPGIVPVFGTGREQGVLFFAMELVDGESLADRIERGPVPAEEAARIASEIAHALQHAHEAGLIHRDVKPDNVIIGADGRARLADFGLVHDLHGARLTRSHFVLGTPAYSAPEQARGEAVDPRSDVYGTGAVLYAMLSGRPPFVGEVPAAVLGRLVTEAPPALAGVAAGAPPALVAICERAMARRPEDRHENPGLLAEELDRFLERDAPDAPDEPPSPSRSSRTRWLLAVGAGAAIAVAAWWSQHRWGLPDGSPAPAPVSAAAVTAGPAGGSFRLLHTIPGRKRNPTLSPDGEMLTFVSDADGRIYIQSVDAARPSRALSADGQPSSPTWSPDGERLAYCRFERLEILDVASGDVDKIDSTCGLMSWSPDGGAIVYPERGWPATRVRILDLESRESRVVTGPHATWPSWSPDGKRIAYVALSDGQYDVWTLPAAGGEPRRVTDDVAREWDPTWSWEPGRLFYVGDRDGTPELWSVRVDTETGRPSDPVAVTRGWTGAPVGMSAARKRKRLALVSAVELRQLWALPLDSRADPVAPPRSLSVDIPIDARSPRRAPGREEWIVAAPSGDTVNLHRVDLDASTFARVTEGPYVDDAPRWSPDGTLIAFHSDRSGAAEIWTVRPDGSDLTRLTHSDADARFPVWSPDGRRLAYTVAGRGPWIADVTDGSAHALETDEESAASPGGEDFVAWSWSGDGNRLAGTRNGIVVYDLVDRRFTRVTDFGERPVWLPGSNELLFTHDDSVFHWRAGDGPREIWSTGPSRLSSPISVADDGRELYFAGTNSPEEIWILDF